AASVSRYPLSFFFFLIRPPPSSTLFLYTTLFRSRSSLPLARSPGLSWDPVSARRSRSPPTESCHAKPDIRPRAPDDAPARPRRGRRDRGPGGGVYRRWRAAGDGRPGDRRWPALPEPRRAAER